MKIIYKLIAGYVLIALTSSVIVYSAVQETAKIEAQFDQIAAEQVNTLFDCS